MRPFSSLTGKRSGAALVGAGRLAVLEIDDPVVQRAGDLAAVHDAVAQRAALVRAAVLEREHLVARGAEDRDLAARRLDRARAARRDRVQRPDVEPEVVGLFHGSSLIRGWSTLAMTGGTGASTASGMNSCSSRPAARSAHGSLAHCALRLHEALEQRAAALVVVHDGGADLCRGRSLSTHFQMRSR